MSFKYTPNTLKKLEELFEEARFTLRYEKGNFASGYCMLEDKKVLVINKFLNTESRINVLLEILNGMTIDEDELSGEMRKWLQTVKMNPLTMDNKVIQTQINLKS